MNNDKTNYRPLLGIALASFIMCGFFFPLLITALAQVVMPYQANGEIATVNGAPVGSYLIAENFTTPLSPMFFHPRNSSDSASGVDPDITLAAAYSQIQGISSATGIPSSQITSIVNQNVEYTSWIAGDPYVNVLKLNVLLVQDFPSVYKT